MSRRLSLVFAAFVIASLACSLGGGAAPGTVAPSAAPTAEPTATAVPEPMSFYDALQAKIESGEWTEGQGLAETLKVFAGENRRTATFGSGPIDASEGTGVLESARQYLQTGTDQAAKDDIQRLLNLLSPSTEDLQNSVPYREGASSTRLAAPARLNCEQSDGTTIPCYQFIDDTVSGQHYKIYLPSAWAADDPGRAFVEPLRQAVRDAVPVYRSLGSLSGARFVFTLTGSPDGPQFTADTFGGSPCPILIYPSALTLSVDSFKQTVAHELFHCWQFGNLGAQSTGVGYAARRWWSEGTAEYFSNVVYPSTNFEYGKLGAYDSATRLQTITGSSDAIAYGNFIFFQFLANRLGNTGVSDLLQHMPTSGGTSEQQAALAAYPNMADLFQEFAQAYWDRAIADTDGGTHMAGPAPVMELFTINDATSRDLPAPAFVIRRYTVIIADTKGFEVALTPTGPEGKNAAEPSPATGAWAALPTAFPCGADPRSYTLVLTSVAAGGAAYNLTLAATVTDPHCVPTPTPDLNCLAGTWEIDSYRDYFLALNPASDSLTYLGESGVWEMQLTRDFVLTMNLEHFVTQYQIDVGGAGPITLALDMDGTATSNYAASGDGHFGTSAVSDGITLAMTMNGEVLQSPQELSSYGFPLGGTIGYTCAGNKLTFLIPVPGRGDVPIVYNRKP